MPEIGLLGNDFSYTSHLDSDELFSTSILSNCFDNILQYSEQESNNIASELIKLLSELPKLREKLSHTEESLRKNRDNVERYEGAIRAKIKDITKNDKLIEKIGSDLYEFKQELLSILLTPLNEELIKLQQDEDKLNSDKKALAEFLGLSIKLRDLCGKPLRTFLKALAYCEQDNEKQDFLKESEFLQKLAQSVKDLQNKGEAIGLMTREESESLAELVGHLLSISKEGLLQENYMEDMLSPIRELVHAVEMDLKRISLKLSTIDWDIKKLSEHINSLNINPLKEKVLDLTAYDLFINLSDFLEGIKVQGLILSREGEDGAESTEEDEYIIIDGLPKGVSSLVNLLKGLKAQKIAPNLTGEQQVELIKEKEPKLIIDSLLRGVDTSEIMNLLRALKTDKISLIGKIKCLRLELEKSQKSLDEDSQAAVSIEKYMVESVKKISKLKKKCQDGYSEPLIQVNLILPSITQHKSFEWLDLRYILIDSEKDFVDYSQEIFRVIKGINLSASNERIEALKDLEKKLNNLAKVLEEYWQWYGKNLSQKFANLTELINQRKKLPEAAKKEIRPLREEAFDFLDSAVYPLILEILDFPIYKDFIAPRLSGSVQNSIRNDIYSLKDILAIHKQTLSQLKREINRISTSLQNKEIENIEQSQEIEVIFGRQQHSPGDLLRKTTPSLMRQLSTEDVVRLETENEIIISVIEYVPVPNTATSSDQENPVPIISNYKEFAITEETAVPQRLEVIRADVGIITLEGQASELSIIPDVVDIAEVSFGIVTETDVAVQLTHNDNKATQSKISPPVITIESLSREDIVIVNNIEIIFTKILEPEVSEYAIAASEVSEKGRAKESIFAFDGYLTEKVTMQKIDGQEALNSTAAPPELSDIEKIAKIIDSLMVNLQVFASNKNTIDKENSKLDDVLFLSKPLKVKAFKAVMLENSDKLFEEKPTRETRKVELESMIINERPLNYLDNQIKLVIAEPETFSSKNPIKASTAIQILDSNNYMMKYYYDFLRRRLEGNYRIN